MNKFTIYYDIEEENGMKFPMCQYTDTYEEVKEIVDGLIASDDCSNIQMVWPETEAVEPEYEHQKDEQLEQNLEILELVYENIDNFDDKEKMENHEWESFISSANQVNGHGWKEENIKLVAQTLYQILHK